jgi:signal transduction histidine kinase
VAGEIIASPSPEAAMQQAWQTVTLVTGIVCTTVACCSILAFLVLGHALLPAVTIIRNLRRLGRGDTNIDIPQFKAPEFRLIADAVKDLADRLAQTTAERLRLTQQLLQVQEDERRMLARDMHDEFGQCLTAAGALAASIEMGADERPDLVSDAEAISRIVERMMTTLRSTLGRLRPPDFDDLGLEASLDMLIANWNGQPGPRAAFSLNIERDLATVPVAAALSIYRIVQECLTNAVRHGRPRSVCVCLSSDKERRDAVSVVVEDDGGGDPAQIVNASGFGILGIRERVAALGGRLAIGRAAGGVRIAATIPLLPSPLAEVA